MKPHSEAKDNFSLKKKKGKGKEKKINQRA